jgi:16S rRNA (cytidine1402-2'-O)-methyltransferase
MPILYLVGTPIGNLEDISLRALRVLREVGLVAAEDTRTSGRLLKHYEIDTPMVSYHEHSGPGRVEEILERLTEEDVALISDAGMPGLSDPGYRLVRAAIDSSIEIVPIPGPSAGVTTLVASGLPTDSYLFLGFMPRRRKARQAKLREQVDLQFTLVVFEAPHRLLALLEDINKTLGNRELCIGREITKLYEEIWRGSVVDALKYFGERIVKGEITVIIEGKKQVEGQWKKAKVREAMAEFMEEGVGRKEAAALVAKESGWRKRDVYNLTIKEK